MRTMIGSEGLSSNDKNSETTRTVTIKLGMRDACVFSVQISGKSWRTVASIPSY